MAFQQKLTYHIDDLSQVALLFAYSGNDTTLGHITIRVEHAGVLIGVPKWNIDLDVKTFLFDPGSIATTTGAALCVAQCIGIAVGKGLLECLWGAKTLKDVEDCLKAKTLGMLLDAAECVARCLGII